MNDHKATIPHVSDALSTVLSNLIPPRAYTFLFTLLPGLFFEISLLLGNPACVYALLVRAQPFIGPSRYASLALALFVGFIIGNAFMFLVLFIQRLLGYLYRFLVFVWEELCAVAAPRLFKAPAPPQPGKPQRPVWWTRHRLLRGFHQHVQAGHQRHFGGPGDRGAIKLWSRLARQLLKTRYGIDAYSLDHAFDQDEFNALYSTMGLLTSEDTRGSIFVIASEAMGWCGLAAAHFAPSLKNRYYIGFSIFLLITGLFHDWYVAASLNNLGFVGVLRVRALLKEYRDTTQHPALPSSPNSPPE